MISQFEVDDTLEQDDPIDITTFYLYCGPIKKFVISVSVTIKYKYSIHNTMTI